MALPNDYSRGLTWRVALPGRQNRAREEGGVFCRHPFPRYLTMAHLCDVMSGAHIVFAAVRLVTLLQLRIFA